MYCSKFKTSLLGTNIFFKLTLKFVSRFVEYKTLREAMAAIADAPEGLNKFLISGRQLHVNFARERKRVSLKIIDCVSTLTNMEARAIFLL